VIILAEVEYQCQPAKESTVHNHAFITIAGVARDHQHGILGTTGPAIYTDDSHVHRIYVRTTTDPKGGPLHWHPVDVTTGPALNLPRGEHTHQFCGETSAVLGHDHRFNSSTDAAPEQRKYDYD